MSKFCLLALALAGASFVSNAHAGFADTVIAYSPGTGFASGYTNPAVSLGQPTTTANPFNPPFQNTQIVSLGAGGSLTIQFNTPVQNDPSHPFGLDFTIFGNSGFIITNGNYSGGGITDGSLFGNNTGATRVSVSRDNVTYYQLNPALAPTVDGLYPTDGSGNFSLPISPALGQGAFAGQDLAGIRALYNGSAGGSSFDISWAEDSNGNGVALSDISYIRVDVLSGKSEIDGFSVVPEPRAWAIALVGACFLLWLGRATRKRKEKRWQSFRTRRFSQLLLAPAVLLAIACNLLSATLTEDFSSNPAGQGWQILGNTNLFHWNSTNGNMEVTWDSSQPNSFFCHSLGTILGDADDFTLDFDLQVTDATGAGYGFELAIGFLNLGDATNATFLRGGVTNSPNLVEFDYFPDIGFGPSIDATVTDTNSLFGFCYDDTLPLVSTNIYHVTLRHASGDSIITGQVLANGQLYTSLPNQYIESGLGDFRIDTISLTSYDGTGSGGSVLAHGIVDNLVVTMPPPPVQNLIGNYGDRLWQVQFTSRTNWLYTLERTSDFQSWIAVSPTNSGTGSSIALADTNAPAGYAFYRVRAARP